MTDVAPAVDTNDDAVQVRALSVLRRGLKISPELRVGLVVTVLLSLTMAIGRLTVPILVQQIIDRGVRDDGGFRPGFVYGACVVAAVVIVAVMLLARVTQLRLVRTAEATLLGLRVRVFDHVHKLSLAEHTDSRRGVLTARVTSDIESLAQFMQWGAVSWIVNGAIILGTIVAMAVYAWPLLLVVLGVYLPLVPVLRYIQRAQLQAYDRVRNRVATTLGFTSEAVTGAAVVRAYGYTNATRRRLHRAVDDQCREQIRAYRWFAFLMPITDMFGVTAMSLVVGLGVWFGDDLGLSAGRLVAFVFLVNLVLNPVTELGEVLDQTQTALAAWGKVLRVLDTPIDVVEPERGVTLPDGPLPVSVRGVRFAYRTGGTVLHDVDVDIAAGSHVAIVGETGSGKTTFARLLVRLADPTSGEVRVGGADLREVDGNERRRRIRMVPQDGFLFDTTIRENIRTGRPDAADDEIDAAIEQLGLRWWVDSLPLGLDTPVGERGDSLSVGERQLVSLARAQIADPSLLVLDEATSAVDPETELAVSDALAKLAAGRTTVTIAHRLSTAERADRVLVFDKGRIVEDGTHDELVEQGGIYATLYRSWLGNTTMRPPEAAR
ncbi:MAG TPA: ABC transporter ATP-binding protein [Acidimicrobiales bacterium]